MLSESLLSVPEEYPSSILETENNRATFLKASMVSIENLMTVQTIPDEYTPERRSSDPAEAVTKEAYAHAYK